MKYLYFRYLEVAACYFASCQLLSFWQMTISAQAVPCQADGPLGSGQAISGLVLMVLMVLMVLLDMMVLMVFMVLLEMMVLMVLWVFLEMIVLIFWVLFLV